MTLLSPASADELLTELIQDQPHAALQQLQQHQHSTSLLAESQRHNQKDWAAHMSPSLAPYSLLGLHIAALHGGNLLSPELYPALKQCESDTLETLCQHFQQPHAHFTHGGSYSNLEALWRARKLSRHTRSTVYASTAVHYSIAKACELLQLDLVLIPCNDAGQIDIDQLRMACNHIAPLAVILNMGSSAIGAIDPLVQAITICRECDSWVHIDAAWGGALMFVTELAQNFPQLALADSISFDPHKSLFQPKPSSVLLYQQTIDTPPEQPDYLATPPAMVLPGSYGGELFLPLWLNLTLLGQDWFTTQIRNRLHQTAQFHQWLRKDNWSCIHSQTGMVCFNKPKQPDLSALVAKGVFSVITHQHKDYYRAVFASHHTDTEQLIRALSRAY